MNNPETAQQQLGDLSAKGVQQELGIGNSKTWELIRTGQLEAYKVGRITRVRRESIEAFKARNRIEPWRDH